MMGGRILVGDSRLLLRELPSESVHCVVTSPPYYGLRDYGVAGQLGLESSPREYVESLCDVFEDVRRILARSGTLWLNLGDSYAGYHGSRSSAVPSSATNGWTRHTNENLRGDRRPADIGLKPKDLMGMPWRVALALQDRGWYLRQEIVWHKPNPAPDGRGTASRFQRSHETMFLLAKSYRYYFKSDPERGSVWKIPIERVGGAHSATFPTNLVRPCIEAGCPPRGVILDPFLGSGTVGLVAAQMGREWIGCELSREYAEMAEKRVSDWGGSVRVEG